MRGPPEYVWQSNTTDTPAGTNKCTLIYATHSRNRAEIADEPVEFVSEPVDRTAVGEKNWSISRAGRHSRQTT